MRYTGIMDKIRLNTIQTAYYRGGTGTEHLLFVHGWASSGRMWLRSMWALRHRYRMWAIDLPGCGDSDSPDLDWYSVEQYTNHLAKFCSILNIQPVAVIGHSMGARLAFDLARRYPDRIQRVVAISPTITGKLSFGLNRVLGGSTGRWALALSRRLWPLATAEVMSMYWSSRYLGTEEVRRTTEDLRRTSRDAAIGGLRAMLRQDYSRYLSKIHQPTLLVHGARDYTVPMSDSKLAKRLLPQSHLVVLDHVHHQPTDEAPAEFLDALGRFLSNGHAA
jgi:pimeloyl-ACP methyl ester carboxylesterase